MTRASTPERRVSAVCRPRFVRLTYTSFYFGSLVLMKGKKEKPSNFIQSVCISLESAFLYFAAPQATGFQARQARRARWRRHTLGMNGCTDSMRVLRLHVADLIHNKYSFPGSPSRSRSRMIQSTWRRSARQAQGFKAPCTTSSNSPVMLLFNTRLTASQRLPQ